MSKSSQKYQQVHSTILLGCVVPMYMGTPGNRHLTKLLLLSKKEITILTILQ